MGFTAQRPGFIRRGSDTGTEDHDASTRRRDRLQGGCLNFWVDRSRRRSPSRVGLSTARPASFSRERPMDGRVGGLRSSSTKRLTLYSAVRLVHRRRCVVRPPHIGASSSGESNAGMAQNIIRPVGATETARPTPGARWKPSAGRSGLPGWIDVTSHGIAAFAFLRGRLDVLELRRAGSRNLDR